MPDTDVKTILLLNSSGGNCSFSVLFHCAKHWAEKGSRVLFISKTPLKCLPLTIGNLDSTHNPESFKLIQFMYLASAAELLQQLYSIHLRHNPVSVIIVKNLENYFNNEPSILQREDPASLVCASLLYAASVCSRIVSRPTVVISEYVSEDSTIERSVVNNFFHNVWELQRTECNGNALVQLSKLSPSLHDEDIVYKFSENLSESLLTFEEIVTRIVS